MRDRRSSDTVQMIREEVGVELFARNVLLIVFLIITGGFLATTHGMVGGVDLTCVILAIIAAGVIAFLEWFSSRFPHLQYFCRKPANFN